MNLSVVILAAGNGKRMLSALPKVLHKVGGISFLERVIHTATSLQPSGIHVVYSNGTLEAKTTLNHLEVGWVEQTEPLGTGHALMQAIPFIPDQNRVLVLYGDVPLITQSTLQAFLNNTPDNSLGLLIAEFENPHGFGRIIRDQQQTVKAIVEQKETTAAQQAIKEINTGIMTAHVAAFKRWLPQLKNQNAQREYYLTDVVAMAVHEKTPVVDTKVPVELEVRGVNNRHELIELERLYQQQVVQRLINQGVSFYDTSRFDCRGELLVDADVIIDIDVIVEGKVSIGTGSKIGPYTLLRDVTIGKNVTINSHCVIDGAIIADNSIIGPFARIRPKTTLGENTHIGNFVELKNVTMDSNSKANHLSYLGDAQIGSHVNVGAGTITCNYDGKTKHQTIIEDGVFIGSGTELVAPVTVKKDAYVGAGSTITMDVPENELAIARARQCTVKGWKNRK